MIKNILNNLVVFIHIAIVNSPLNMNVALVTYFLQLLLMQLNFLVHFTTFDACCYKSFIKKLQVLQIVSRITGTKGVSDITHSCTSSCIYFYININSYKYSYVSIKIILSCRSTNSLYAYSAIMNVKNDIINSLCAFVKSLKHL